jgi:4-hydroxymandelate oxidase
MDWVALVVKGVLRADDAVACIEAGAAAVIVSNYGGRELDTVPATAEVLGTIAAKVGVRAEVYVDGGIRHGHDVIKAMALGARSVLIGRPYLWGLAVAGSGRAGSGRNMTEELRVAMSLCGVSTLGEITDDLLRRQGRYAKVSPDRPCDCRRLG